MNKWKTVALGALLLWVATIALGAFMITREVTTLEEDGRAVIDFNQGEVDFTLEEMRGLLETVHDIVLALDGDDMAGVADAVDGKGVAEAMANTPKSILAKIPLEFRTLGMAMHGGFEEIGTAAAAEDADTGKIVELLGDQIGRCVACHASYKLP